MDIELAGAVLCGGMSRRMGEDKALLASVPGGPPLYRQLADLLATIAAPVILAPGVIGRLGATGLPEVADSDAGSGPLGGIVAALGASPHLCCAVVAVDMPQVSPALLRLLATLCGDRDVAVPLVGGAPEPLHAVYSRRALPVLTGCLREGKLGLRAALASLDARVVTMDEWGRADPSGGFALNLNSPEDLHRWRRAN